ncbi:NmrA family transcriptional regulator [Antrihabitans sp. YC2-6]|uniref:NmrA family transcriptional regulator n=1 Tax=Antrihabitans sp. YC2-6 TaxID=2799498 RepID=UPI001F3E5825|nr:NmrA family transcriptional regulator [Antrihabitans sp. YC2-6]
MTVLVVGSTGKTGRRVAERLQAKGVAVREGSRNSSIPFDWENRETWGRALDGVDSAYVTYFPDLAAPGSIDAMTAFTALAAASGLRRLVLLAGRGEEDAEACERIVQGSGLECTIIRATWFAQNFNESYFLEPILAGEIALPVDGVLEPFVDADDIADVAVAALTEDGHVGKVYELTGPRLLTFADAIAEIAQAAGRHIEFVSITPDDFAAGMREQGAPDDVVELLVYLFTTVLDGRNSVLADGVAQALGRPPRDFSEFVRGAAAAGAWTPATSRVG